MSNTWAMGLPLVYAGYFVLMAVVHVAFAAGVTADAKQLSMTGKGTFVVGPGMWGFATLLGGVVVATAYWLIHHSNLRSKLPPWEEGDSSGA